MKIKRLFAAIIIGAALTAGFLYLNNNGVQEFSENRAVEIFETDGTAGNIGVISFSSPYCAACKKQKKEVDLLKSELSDDAVFKMIDVTKDAQTPNYYDVGIVPTILITYKGMEVGRFTGLHKAGDIEGEIRKQIEKHRYCEDGTIC